MKILLSGMTKMQANRPRRREYNTSIAALYQALIAAKHQVDWRSVGYDEEDLEKKYDVLLLGLGTMSEFSCTNLYEILLASRYDNVIYFVNDWKANATIKLLETGDIFRDFVLRNNATVPEKREQLVKDEKKIERCRAKMFRFGGENLLGPFFNWGDRDIITNGTPFTKIHEFNPTIYYMKHWDGKIEVPAKKTKQWVYGALSDYSKWHTKLGASWPIRAFNKKTFIPEPELVELYAQSYGLLLPKYKASGSGWWRARYCHGMLCQNVIHGDETELRELNLWDAIDYIEGLSNKRLTELARVQKETIMKLTPSWRRVVRELDLTIREALPR